MFLCLVELGDSMFLNNFEPDEINLCFYESILHVLSPPLPSASTKLKGRYTAFTLSVCLSVDRIVSALYLQQYLRDPFHICTSYQATSESVSREMFVSKFKNLKFWQILF